MIDLLMVDEAGRRVLLTAAISTRLLQKIGEVHTIDLRKL
jgi:hypothetical protein